MKRYQFITLSVLLTVLIGGVLITQAGASPLLGSGAPTVVSYQGVVKDGGTPFTGTGYFKFALVDAAGTTTYWSNDGSSSGGGEPTSGVQLIVANGLFQVLLGDTDLTHMTALPASAFSGTERYLRIWFSPDDLTYTTLSPDQQIAAVPYALQAEEALHAADADTLDGLDSTDLYTRAEVDALLADYDARIADLETLLASVSLENGGNDFVFTDINVHVRSGSGSTAGAINGRGNLIVGYNENSGNARTGSHNLVVGPYHSYSGYGGLVAGYKNNITANYSSVSGGYHNSASGQYASVSGGRDNSASGAYSSISGGYENIASNMFDSVSGGYENTASGGYSSVSGGRLNTASHFAASVSGGYQNTAGNSYATISGGGYNISNGYYSSVSGGSYNTASGNYSSVLGGGGDAVEKGNEAWAHYSVIAGGRYNVAGDDAGTDRTVGEASAVLAGQYNGATGDFSTISGGQSSKSSGYSSSVSGGRYNIASGDYSSVLGGGGEATDAGNEAWAHYSVVASGMRNVAGDNGGTDRKVGEASAVLAGWFNRAIGACSSVSGGVSNIASGMDSSVSGGDYNIASGYMSSISAGYDNEATGDFSSISGGVNNIASGDYSSISGGAGNTASGFISSVSGGYNHESSGQWDWRAGGLFQDQ